MDDVPIMKEALRIALRRKEYKQVWEILSYFEDKSVLEEIMSPEEYEEVLSFARRQGSEDCELCEGTLRVPVSESLLSVPRPKSPLSSRRMSEIQQHTISSESKLLPRISEQRTRKGQTYVRPPSAPLYRNVPKKKQSVRKGHRVSSSISVAGDYTTPMRRSGRTANESSHFSETMDRVPERASRRRDISAYNIFEQAKEQLTHIRSKLNNLESLQEQECEGNIDAFDDLFKYQPRAVTVQVQLVDLELVPSYIFQERCRLTDAFSLSDFEVESDNDEVINSPATKRKCPTEDTHQRNQDRNDDVSEISVSSNSVSTELQLTEDNFTATVDASEPAEEFDETESVKGDPGINVERDEEEDSKALDLSGLDLSGQQRDDIDEDEEESDGDMNEGLEDNVSTITEEEREEDGEDSTHISEEEEASVCNDADDVRDSEEDENGSDGTDVESVKRSSDDEDNNGDSYVESKDLPVLGNVNQSLYHSLAQAVKELKHMISSSNSLLDDSLEEFGKQIENVAIEGTSNGNEILIRKSIRWMRELATLSLQLKMRSRVDFHNRSASIAALPISPLLRERTFGRSCNLSPVVLLTNKEDKSTQTEEKKVSRRKIVHKSFASHDEAATAIQTSYRGHVGRRRYIQLKEGIKKIENVMSSYQSRKRRKIYGVRNARLLGIWHRCEGRSEKKTKRWLMRFMTNVYKAKIQSDIASDRAGRGRIPLPDFLFEYIRQTFGTKSIVDEFCGTMISTLTSYGGEQSDDIAIVAFTRFVKEVWSLPILSVYLSSLVAFSSITSAHPTQVFVPPIDLQQPVLLDGEVCEDIILTVFREWKALHPLSDFLEDVMKCSDSITKSDLRHRVSSAQVPVITTHVSTAGGKGQRSEVERFRTTQTIFLHCICRVLTQRMKERSDILQTTRHFD